MTEEWRPTHHPDYDVSNLGRVRSRARGKCHILKPRLNPNGYPGVQFGRKASHRVHRLVAAAFIGPCPAGQEVRHKDDNPGNPRWDNLEYGTRTQNILDSVKRGRWVRVGIKGEANTRALLTTSQVLDIRTLNGVLWQADIAKMYGVSRPTITAIVGGRNWKHV